MNLKQMAQQVQDAGKGGDIHLIHVNDEELKLIKKALGFEGSLNEDTGLLSFETREQFVAAAARTDVGVSSVDAGRAYDSGVRSSSNASQLKEWKNQQAVAAADSNAYRTWVDQQEMAQRMSLEQMDASYNYAVMASERVQRKFPEWAGTSREVVESDVPWMNAMISREYESALDRLYPQWRTDIIEASADSQADSVFVTNQFRKNVMPKVLAAADEMGMQAISNSAALLRGDIPDDVAAQIKRNAAEIGQQIGARGQSAGNIVARDLGLTSLQLQEAGLNQSQAALGLGAQAYSIVNQTLQAPVTTGANVTNLMSAYRAPTVDPSAMYQNYLGIISGQGAISPNTVLGTSAQVGTQFAQMGQAQAQFRTELGSQTYWNQINADLQQQAINASAQGSGMKWGGLVGAGIGALGAGLVTGGMGAGMGAAVGGSIGGSTGY